MSNRYSLKISFQAERDLDDIFMYIAHDLSNASAAAGIIDKIVSALNSLKDMPKRCPLSDISELRKDGYRKLVVEKYIALYTIEEKQKTVKVVKVFYGMRDYRNIGLF